MSNPPRVIVRGSVAAVSATLHLYDNVTSPYPTHLASSYVVAVMLCLPHDLFIEYVQFAGFFSSLHVAVLQPCVLVLVYTCRSIV